MHHRILVRYLRAAARKHRAYVLEIGMVTTHVHLLIRIHPTSHLSRLMQGLKGGSAMYGNRDESLGPSPLRWAKGYSMQSVGSRGLDAVRAYLRSQPTHHPDERIIGWAGDRPEFDREG